MVERLITSLLKLVHGANLAFDKWSSPHEYDAGSLSDLKAPKRHSALRRTAFVWSLLLALTSCLPTHGQRMSNGNTGVSGEWDFRYDLFQMLLEENGLQVVRRFDEAFERPRKSVVVLLGQPTSSTKLSNRLLDYVEDGGHLLIATDGPWEFSPLGRVDFGPARVDDASVQYKLFPDCMQLQLRDTILPLSSDLSLVTNRAGWFQPSNLDGWNWESALTLPKSTMPRQAAGKAVLAVGRAASNEALSESVAKRAAAAGEGFVVVSSDASLLSNGMLWHGDNQRFAIEMSRVLTERDRTTLLFLVDGRFMGSFLENDLLANGELEAPPTPETDLQKALRLANAVVNDVQKSNVLNEALRQQPRRARPDRYARALIVVLATAFTLLTLWWLLASATARYPRLAPRRMLAAYELRGKNGRGPSADYRQPASLLAREFCFGLTGSHHSADWQTGLSEIKRGPSAWSEKQQIELARIVDVACRGFQTRLTESEFQQFGKKLTRLQAQAELNLDQSAGERTGVTKTNSHAVDARPIEH